MGIERIGMAKKEGAMRTRLITRWAPAVVIALSLLLSVPTGTALGEASSHSPVTVRLVPGARGYGGAVDTYLHEWFPDETHDTRELLAIRGDGAVRPLLRFDLTGVVPEGAVVTRARLRFRVIGGSATSMNASLYRVLRPWSELWANWSTSGFAGGWEAPGAGEPGVDRAELPEHTIGIKIIGWVCWFNVTDLVRDWVAAPDQNYGMLVVGHGAQQGGQFEIASAEYPHVWRRPTLEITYVNYWNERGPDPDAPVAKGWSLLSTEYGNVLGSDSIRYTDLMLSDLEHGATALTARLDAAEDRMYLMDPESGQWEPAGGSPLGQPAVLTTTLACLDVGGSSKIVDPGSILVTWVVKLRHPASGHRYQLLLRQGGADGQMSEWEAVGEVVHNRPPELIAPRLNAQEVPTGAKQLFTPWFRDPDGHGNLADAYFAITDLFPTSPDAKGLVLRYDAQAGRLYLRGDDGAWLPEDGVEPRTDFVLENAYGIVYGPGSRVINSDSLTLSTWWVVEFKPEMEGRYWLYMRAADIVGDAYGGDTRWKWKGWVDVLP